jgi:hypothetical protein
MKVILRNNKVIIDGKEIPDVTNVELRMPVDEAPRVAITVISSELDIEFDNADVLFSVSPFPGYRLEVEGEGELIRKIRSVKENGDEWTPMFSHLEAGDSLDKLSPRFQRLVLDDKPSNPIAQFAENFQDISGEIGKISPPNLEDFTVIEATAAGEFRFPPIGCKSKVDGDAFIYNEQDDGWVSHSPCDRCNLPGSHLTKDCKLFAPKEPS